MPTTKRLYLFGHIEHYDSYIHGTTKKWTNKTIFAAGVNYYPIPQIAIKAEYNYRNLKKGYNDEPAINIGVALRRLLPIRRNTPRLQPTKNATD